LQTTSTLHNKLSQTSKERLTNALCRDYISDSVGICGEYHIKNWL